MNNTYNPEKDAPRTIEQYNICVDHFTNKSATEHAEAVAAATASAEAAYANLPDSDDKPTLAEFVAQAVSAVPQAEPREYFEKMFACYYPQEMPEEPAPTFAELKAQKKAELGAAFYTACQRPTVQTAGGWPADANETANRNVQGLITTMEATGAETVQFCDANNQFHEVTLEELRAIQLQIIALGQTLYARKWQLREAIEQAQSEAELAAITISFAA